MKFTTPLFSSMALIAMLLTGSTAQAANSANTRTPYSRPGARFNSTVALFTKDHTDIAAKVYTDVATNAVVKHDIARELHVTYFGLWTSKHSLSTKQSAELGSAVQDKIKQRVDSELEANYLSRREHGYTQAVTKSCKNRDDKCIGKEATKIVNNAIGFTVHSVNEVSTKVLHRVNDDINDAIKAYGSKLFSLNLWVVKFQVKGDVSLVEEDISNLLQKAPNHVKSQCRHIRTREIDAIKKNQFSA
ncbi:hypothetical protein BGZ75_010064 [Mortierella antarctica]|nr:hypothetical protein BGZ67_003495 [Mortierella alpina]KAF9988100.1 hypothetical protein BGZ75_010064 [Mortierella antarctica]